MNVRAFVLVGALAVGISLLVVLIEFGSVPSNDVGRGVTRDVGDERSSRSRAEPYASVDSSVEALVAPSREADSTRIVTGRVYGTEDEPVVGAKVFARPSEGSDCRGAVAETGRGGEFSLEVARVCDYTLLVLAVGYWPGSSDSIDASAEIRLTPTRSIDVLLVDARSSARVDREGVDIDVALDGAADTPWISQAEGLVRLDAPADPSASVRVRGVGPGGGRAVVTAPGYREAEFRLPPDDGRADGIVRVVLRRSYDLAIDVVDDAGRDVPDCHVDLTYEHPSSGRVAREATTGVDGRAAFDDVPVRRVRFDARSDRIGAARGDEITLESAGSTHVTVMLVRDGELVIEGGDDWSGGRLGVAAVLVEPAVFVSPGAAGRFIAPRSRSPGSLVRVFTVDERTAAVPPGRYALVASRRGAVGARAVAEAFAADALPASRAVTMVTIEPGARTAREIGAPLPASLWGTLDHGAGPTTVALWPALRVGEGEPAYSTRAGSDGLFEITDMDAGSFMLLAWRDPHDVPYARRIDVEPMQATEVRLAMGEHTVEGVVVDAVSGDVVAGVPVELEVLSQVRSEGGSELASIAMSPLAFLRGRGGLLERCGRDVSGEDGRFAFRRLNAGSYAVRAVNGSAFDGRYEVAEVGAGAPHGGLRLAVTRAHALDGVVHLGDAAEREDVSVFLCREATVFDAVDIGEGGAFRFDVVRDGAYTLRVHDLRHGTTVGSFPVHVEGDTTVVLDVR